MKNAWQKRIAGLALAVSIGVGSLLISLEIILAVRLAIGGLWAACPREEAYSGPCEPEISPCGAIFDFWLCQNDTGSIVFSGPFYTRPTRNLTYAQISPSSAVCKYTMDCYWDWDGCHTGEILRGWDTLMFETLDCPAKEQ